VGGTTGGTVPTGGAAGSPPVGGTGGAPLGGTGGAPIGGTGGDISTGGMGGELLGGMGGMTGGTAGMGGSLMGGMGGMTGGTAGTGMGGAGTTGCPECTMVGTPLDAQTILMPCGMQTETRVCIPMGDSTRPCTNPGGNTAPSYSGTHSFNNQITLGGTPGVMYRISLRIRGMVEAKTYTGGMDRASNGTQVPADGLYTGGYANNSGNGYNIYFIRTDSPLQHYYLNSIGAGSDTRIRHSVFDTDFTFDMVAAGGSTVCLVSADPNTSAIKNCAEPDVGNVCNPVTLQNLDPMIASDIGNQPYNGQFMGIRVTGVTRM
jgi:hypothetical protein